MRVKSAYAATHKGGQTLQKIPRPGTKLRELYDLFQMNKGIVIEEPLTMRYNYTYFIFLRDFYGLDIRKIGEVHKGRGRGTGRWILAGEWFGANYVDYIARNKQKLSKVEKFLEG